MADAEKGTEVQPKVEETTTDKSTPRNYSEGEFKEVVDQRQTLKRKLEQYEKADAKRKEEAEAAAKEKAIAEGDMKAVLEAQEQELKTLKEKAERYEDQEKQMRKDLIGKLSDDTDKKVAKDISSVATLQEFVNARSEDKTVPDPSKGSPGGPKLDIRGFKGNYDDLTAHLKAAGVPINDGSQD